MLCRHLPFMDLLSAKEAMGGPISGEDRGGITGIIIFSLSPFTYNISKTVLELEPSETSYGVLAA